MPRRNDPDRIRHAMLLGAATAVRDQVVLADPEMIEAQRQVLPELWRRIDSLCELAVGAQA